MKINKPRRFFFGGLLIMPAWCHGKYEEYNVKIWALILSISLIFELSINQIRAIWRRLH